MELPPNIGPLPAKSPRNPLAAIDDHAIDKLRAVIKVKHQHDGQRVADKDDNVWLGELAQQINISPGALLTVLQNWGTLTAAQKDKILKFLVAFYLVAAQRLFLFKLERGG